MINSTGIITQEEKRGDRLWDAELGGACIAQAPLVRFVVDLHAVDLLYNKLYDL
jgi:hypothetical protein